MLDLFINALYALAIAAGAFWLSGEAKARIANLPKLNKDVDPTLATFGGSIIRYLILVLAVIFILGRFGIETTSLAALIGAAGLAVGLALQGTLANFAAGVMLIVFRPVKIGDFVTIGGESGTVRQITIYFTELATVDNVQIIIPNSNVWSNTITNYSAHGTRRLDLTFGVSYDSDLKLVEETLLKIIKADARFHVDPAPFVKVTNLGDFSVDFTIRVWCSAADYWDLRFYMLRAVKDTFDAKGIDIPFPTQTQIEIRKADT